MSEGNVDRNAGAPTGGAKTRTRDFWARLLALAATLPTVALALRTTPTLYSAWLEGPWPAHPLACIASLFVALGVVLCILRSVGPARLCALSAFAVVGLSMAVAAMGDDWLAGRAPVLVRFLTDSTGQAWIGHTPAALLTMLAVALHIAALKRWSPTALWSLAGVCVFATLLGVNQCVAMLLATDLSAGTVATLAFDPVFALTCCAAAMSMLAWRNTEAQNRTLFRAAPALAAVFGVALTILTFSALSTIEQERTDQIVRVRAEAMKQQVATDMQRVITPLVVAAAAGSPAESMLALQRELTVRPDEAALYDAFGFIDPSLTLRWFNPSGEPGKSFSYQREPELADLLRGAARLHAVIMTRPAADLGHAGYCLFVPVRRADRFIGFVVGVFSNEKLFNHLFEGVGAEYRVAVANPSPCFALGDLSHEQMVGGTQVPVDLFGTRWDVTLMPRPALARRMASPTPHFLLVAGTAGSLMLGLIVVLVNGVRQRTVEVARIGKSLDQHVHEKKQAQELLEFQASALSQLNDAVYTLDRDSRITYWNKACERLYRFTQQQVIGRRLEDLIKLQWADGLSDEARQEAMTGAAVWRGESTFESRDGTRYVEACVSTLRDPFGAITGRLCVVRDITDRRRAEEQVRYAATHDALTGLANRVHFRQRLESCITRAKEEPGYSFAVFFLDLDRFKFINDSLGHHVGDELLKTISRKLQERVAQYGQETWPEGRHMVARMGGDEFTVLLDNIHNLSQAQVLADHMLADLNVPYQFDGHEVCTTVSIGIAPGSVDTDADALLRDADTAMYCAKTGGKARYEVFDAHMHEKVSTRVKIETELRHALDRNELSLQYQPIMSLESNRLIAFEALIRWIRPERKIISPTDFIALAEENNMIVPIGAWAIDTACAQLAAWHRQYPADPPLAMSINVSRKQLADPGFAATVRAAIDRHRVPPSSLKLEVTESLVMADPQAAMVVLEQLKELDVELSMDDFGTGHSSLSCLHTLPFDNVKIDRSFICNMSDRFDYAAVVQSIVTLAHNLNMKIVAEGVDRPEQLAQLQSLECDQAQGFYFAKAMDTAESETFIRQHLPMDGEQPLARLGTA